MHDPRVAVLATELLGSHFFDSDLDARRAAKRVVQKMDSLAPDEKGPVGLDPIADDPAAQQTTECVDGSHIARPANDQPPNRVADLEAQHARIGT